MAAAAPRRKKRNSMPKKASADIAKKPPTNGIGSNQCRVRMIDCGPSTAAARPPAIDHEIALARNAGLPASATAKRYWLMNAFAMPAMARPMVKPRKLPANTA
jgi:hypothetical protein